MARSDLFLISNYVHLACEEYMILILMMVNVAGLFISSLPSAVVDNLHRISSIKITWVQQTNFRMESGE